MKALLLKDFYNLSKTAKIMIIVTAAYGIFGLVSGEPSFLTGLIAVYCAIIPVTTFSYDDFSKWDTYAQSMPISRKSIVLEKYVLGIVLVLIGSSISMLFGILTGLTNGLEINFAELLGSTGAVALLCLLMQSLVLPIIIKFGVERGRIAMFAVFFTPAILTMLIAKNPPPQLMSLNLEAMIVPIIIAVVAAIIIVFILSVYFSLKTYNAKEF